MMHQSSRQACEETASYIGRIQSNPVQSSLVPPSTQVVSVYRILGVEEAI
jgi:hypothetical protein